MHVKKKKKGVILPPLLLGRDWKVFAHQNTAVANPSSEVRHAVITFGENIALSWCIANKHIMAESKNTFFVDDKLFCL